jgi:hypothetical protein
MQGSSKIQLKRVKTVEVMYTVGSWRMIGIYDCSKVNHAKPIAIVGPEEEHDLMVSVYAGKRVLRVICDLLGMECGRFGTLESVIVECFIKNYLVEKEGIIADNVMWNEGFRHTMRDKIELYIVVREDEGV